jgi:hypothetical protein
MKSNTVAEQQAPLGDILEKCLEAIEIQGWSVDDCLAHYAAYRHHLEPLLKTAQRLRWGQAVSPSMAFQEQAVWRLRARLQHTDRPPQKPSLGRSTPFRAGPPRFLAQPRFASVLIALLAVLVLSALTTGTIHAAASALPGEPLYPIEQTVEQVRLGLAAPPKALELRMSFADKRLSEAEQLGQKGDTSHMEEALDGYNQLVMDIMQTVDTDSSAGDLALLDGVNTRLALHEARLQALLRTAPPAAQAGLTRAIEAAKQGQEHAAQAINKQHGGGKPENTPGEGKPGKPGNGKPQGTPGGKPDKPDRDKPEKPDNANQK